MKKALNTLAGVQILGASLLGLITLLNFEPEVTWFLFGCVLTGVVALGLIIRSKLALVAELLLLIPVCGLLVFQTANRVLAIFTGVWRECPPAFFMGFMFEQIVLIPEICMGILLVLCRREFSKPEGEGGCQQSDGSVDDSRIRNSLSTPHP